MNYSMGKRTFNPLAAGSIPARPTKKNKGFGALYLDALFSFLAKSRLFFIFCVQIAYKLRFAPGFMSQDLNLRQQDITHHYDLTFYGVEDI